MFEESDIQKEGLSRRGAPHGILVIEEEPAIRNLLQEYLQIQGVFVSRQCPGSPRNRSLPINSQSGRYRFGVKRALRRSIVVLSSLPFFKRPTKKFAIFPNTWAEFSDNIDERRTEWMPTLFR